MPRPETAPVAEEQEQEQVLPYDLEPMDEILQSRLDIWGRATNALLSNINGSYPEWARMISDMKDTLAIVIKGASE